MFWGTWVQGSTHSFQVRSDIAHFKIVKLRRGVTSDLNCLWNKNATQRYCTPSSSVIWAYRERRDRKSTLPHPMRGPKCVPEREARSSCWLKAGGISEFKCNISPPKCLFCRLWRWRIIRDNTRGLESATVPNRAKKSLWKAYKLEFLPCHWNVESVRWVGSGVFFNSLQCLLASQFDILSRLFRS